MGDKNLTATIESVQVNPCERDDGNGVPMLRARTHPRRWMIKESILITRLSDEKDVDTDVNDLKLSARIFKLNGEDYVRATSELSGTLHSNVTPSATDRGRNPVHPPSSFHGR